MLPDDPLARGRRRTILIAAATAVLVLCVVAGKLSTMLVAQSLGERAWRDGDAVAAERYFEIAGRVNVVQRWIASFNRGVAAHGQREWDEAARWFEAAMEVAPDSARCRVALNWSWSLEAAGDELAARDEDDEAALRWTAADGVLGKAVGCDQSGAGGQPTEPDPPEEPSDEPSQDAEPSDPGEEPPVEDGDPGGGPGSEQGQVDETQQRLNQKRGGGGGDPAPAAERPAGEDQAERLAERNQEAARDRQSSADDDGEPTSPDGPRRTW